MSEAAARPRAGLNDGVGRGLDGWFDDVGVHHFPVRVYYEDTDAGGVVYHANYLRFMERARTAYLRALGLRLTEVVEQWGVAFAVRRATVDFQKPAKLDDTLEVLTRIDDIRGASFAAAQWIERDGARLVSAEIKVAAITAQGRPARMPRPVGDALTRALGPGGDAGN